ncbi:hypothetical protein BDB01DRAFT_797874 [Pilobolus umbonatus]|nr:hypothetical protein BDB01DRAFT_797874 [Pilobolus umbonatus]
MCLVRSFGVKLYIKGWRNLNSVEKYLAELCLNSIVNLHDNLLMKAVGLDKQAIQDLQKRFMINEPSFQSIDREIHRVRNKAAKALTLREKYNIYVTSSLVFDGDVRKKLEVLASVYKNFVFKKNNIDSWKTMSELSVIIKIWSNVFEVLFEEESDIRLVWGDTKNEKFKVDLRLCFIMNSKYYDLANIEFKKNSGNQKEDEGKVLVEGKTILNSLSKYHNLDIDTAKELKVIVGQFCGLKGVFKQIRFAAPSAYMVDRWGKTIKYPVHEGMIDTFLVQLQQLIGFKDEIIKQAQDLKGRLLEDNSSFGSPLAVEDQSFAKETYYLSRKARIFPKLNDDIFK